MAETRYFQFPLCLLQFADRGTDGAALFRAALAWTIVEGGRSVWEDERYHDSLHDLIMDPATAHTNPPEDFDPSDPFHRYIFSWMEVRVWELPDWPFAFYTERYCKLRDHVETYLDALDGKAGDMQVRARFDLMQQLMRGRMPVRSFRVLAGLYAAIGSHPYRRVSLKHMRFLSAGYKSEAAFRSSGGSENNLLTTDQLRYTRDKLLDSRWLFRYHDGRRNYYSHRLNNAELTKAVTGGKLARKKRKIEELRSDLTRQQELDNLDAEIERLTRKKEGNSHRGDGSLPTVSPTPLDRFF